MAAASACLADHEPPAVLRQLLVPRGERALAVLLQLPVEARQLRQAPVHHGLPDSLKQQVQLSRQLLPCSLLAHLQHVHAGIMALTLAMMMGWHRVRCCLQSEEHFLVNY
jgi:hypothetical protein